MKISQKSVEFLQKFINGEEGPEYRSGQMLVSLFNDFGFDYFTVRAFQVAGCLLATAFKS
jgi:hypothetical protein